MNVAWKTECRCQCEVHTKQTVKKKNVKSRKMVLDGFPVPPGSHSQSGAALSSEWQAWGPQALASTQLCQGLASSLPGHPGRAGHRSPGRTHRRASEQRHEGCAGKCGLGQPPEFAAPLAFFGSRCSLLTARSPIQIPHCSCPIGQPHARRALPIGWAWKSFCTLIGWLLFACYSNQRGGRLCCFLAYGFIFKSVPETIFSPIGKANLNFDQKKKKSSYTDRCL